MNDQAPIPPQEITQLVEENKLLRILRPDLRQKLRQIWTRSQGRNPYIIENGEHIYLSLADIRDDRERQHLYHLVQRYQTGEHVNLNPLPSPLRQLIQPELTQASRFLGALLFGALGGIVIGVFALAIGILILATTAVTIGLRLANEVQLTSFIFVTFSALGWVAATTYFWRRSPKTH